MIKYLFAVIASGALAVSLSGCRLGNRISQAEAADPYTGYYASQPQTYDLYATYNSQTKSASVNPSQLPSLATTYFTNPEIFVYNSQNGAAALVPWSNLQTGIPVVFSTDQKTVSFPSSPIQQGAAWDDGACALTEYLEVSGGLQARGSSDPATTSVNGAQVPVTGRLQVTMSASRVFTGDCTGSLQGMRACYEDLTKCQGSTTSANEGNQAYVADIFAAPITAGIMTSADIETATNVAYVVQFQ